MILLIPLQYLNEACAISENTDEKKLKMVLNLAQDNLKEILSPEFYEIIEDEYDNDTFSTENETLYEDYIKNYLAWQTYSYHLQFSQSDSTPTGQRSFREENSDILADAKLAALEKNVREKADDYKNKMLNFLRNERAKDSTAFPYWKELCKTSFTFGITVVGGQSDASFRVDQAVRNNE